jgi:hypothetical protein
VEKARNSRGQFISGNPGRPVGSGNKRTTLQKVRIDEVLSILSESLLDDLSTMKPREKIELWKDLQEFIQPKLQRVAVDLDTPDDKITKITFEVVKESSEIAN